MLQSIDFKFFIFPIIISDSDNSSELKKKATSIAYRCSLLIWNHCHINITSRNSSKGTDQSATEKCLQTRGWQTWQIGPATTNQERIRCFLPAPISLHFKFTHFLRIHSRSILPQARKDRDNRENLSITSDSRFMVK